ncbi:hypothetical protein LTR28_003101 [Elasticomyces elasticus]|nr:hypothetical protein LTR28_003101 [Elasticomyces elasticus]
MEVAGVPAVLAYRGQGEIFAALVPLADELPDDAKLDARSLERVLSNLTALDPVYAEKVLHKD